MCFSGSADSVKWAEKLIDILIQDPNVDITEHIPKNLAHTLSLSSSGNSGSSGSGGGGGTSKKPNTALVNVYTSNQQQQHFLPVSQNPNAYQNTCMQKPSSGAGTSSSMYLPSSSMKGKAPIVGGAPSQPMATVGGYSNPSVGVIGSKPLQASQNRGSNGGNSNIPNGAGPPSYNCNNNYPAPSVWKNAATASADSNNSNNSNLDANGISRENFSLLSNILNQGPSTNIWQGSSRSSVADNSPEDSHSSIGFNHSLSAQIDCSAPTVKGR